jgi:hypothetical protein
MPIAFPPTLYSREPLLSGDAGVEQTINEMRGLVDEALRDPSIIRLATDIVRSAPAFDDLAEANALYEWVRRNIRFTKDPVNKEKLYPPAELLKIRAGDCDDISMLLGTLLMAVGYPARLMTVAAGGDEFSHVYVEGNVNGEWIAMDPARYDSQFGVAPPAFTRARWWSLTDAAQGDLSGMLGNYPRYMAHVSGIGAYGPVHRMSGMGALGDCAPGDVWTGSVCLPPSASGADGTSSTIATIEQGTADIIRASQGIPASPFSYSSGPYASFQTAYSPGMIPAGYVNPALQPNLSLTANSNIGLWLALAAGALLLMGGRR